MFVQALAGWACVCAICIVAPLGRFPFSGCINHRCLVHIEYVPLDTLGPHRFVCRVVVSHVLLCVSPLFHSFSLI